MAHSVLLAAGILVTQQMNTKKGHNDNVTFYIAVFENSVDRANYIVPLSQCANSTQCRKWDKFANGWQGLHHSNHPLQAAAILRQSNTKGI